MKIQPNWSRHDHHSKATADCLQLLDRLLGAHDEPTTYRKAELKTFVSLGVEDMLGQDEVALLGSVLEFAGKQVSDVMVRLPLTSPARKPIQGEWRWTLCFLCLMKGGSAMRDDLD